MKADRTTTQLLTIDLIIKFCNNFWSKSSLSSIGLLAQPHNLSFQAEPGNESNPCGLCVPPTQSCQLKT